MNNKVSLTYLFLITATTPFFFDCCGPDLEDNKNNASESSVSLGHVASEKYVIDKNESILTWTGSMQFIEEGQTGYVHISKGELIIENGQLVGSTVEVDMNTIEDKSHGRDNNLVNHLKDPDFFDVEKFPVSTLVVTKVTSLNGENIKVTGNLTIKGITHTVTFPAKMEVKGGIVKANGNVVIDRTKWNVRYRSGEFYDDLADKTISDSVEFHIKIVAKNKHLNP